MNFFSRYSGAGNLFLIGDNRKGLFPLSSICNLSFQHKVDGVILLEDSSLADYKMRIFNPDGKEAEMCGNGLRCLVHFIGSFSTLRIETLAGIYTAWREGDLISVEMQPPTKITWHLSIQNQVAHFLNTGVPHTVLFPEIFPPSIEELGGKIRHDPFFAPLGTNVNFVSLLSKEKLAVRTYERGVERETLACGTGVMASALAASYLYGLASPLLISVQSGEELLFTFDSSWKKMILTGPVKQLLTLERTTRILNNY